MCVLFSKLFAIAVDVADAAVAVVVVLDFGFFDDLFYNIRDIKYKFINTINVKNKRRKFKKISQTQRSKNFNKSSIPYSEQMALLTHIT